MLSKDIAWARSEPGKFRMQYLPGKISCCRSTAKKFCEGHKYVKGKREREREHNEIRSMNLSVSNAETPYSLPTDGHKSDGLVSRPERPIILQLHKGYWHVEKSCGVRKSIVINGYDQYMCQHNYF